MRFLVFGMALAGVILCGGCGGSGPTVFLHPGFDFSFIEKVGVVPFENLSGDQGAGARATRYFVNALLSSESFDVVEPGEVSRVLESQSVIRTAQMTEAQYITAGRELGLQGFFVGSVSESTALRSGSNTVNVVTVVLRLIETETGATVWSVTHSEDSQGFMSSLFGTNQDSLARITRKCLDGCLNTLLD